MTVLATFALASIPSVAASSPSPSPSPSPSARAAAPTDGPLLSESRSLVARNGTQTYLFFQWQGRGLTFSPDGAKIAGVVDDSTVVVWTNTGTTSELATLVGDIQAIAWSPDQSQLAVMTSDSGFVGRLYRVDAVTGAATLIVQGTSTFRLDYLSSDSISWHPTNGTIAFLASQTDEDGSSLVQDADQVFTVPAAGGTPTRFNARTPDCAYPSCLYYQFSQLDWSPDGSKLAVLVNKETENYEQDTWTSEQYVGTLTNGATHPAKVKQTSSYTDVSSYSHLGSGPLNWSTDGTQILYGQRQVQHGDTTPTIISATTGATTGTFAYTFLYRDWQPCPTGTCAVWGKAVPRAKATLKGWLPSVTWTKGRRPQTKGTLTVTPGQQATGPIKLLVDGKQVRSALLTAAMNNVFTFKLPKLSVGRHTVQLRYGGSTKVEPAVSGIGKVRVTKN